MKKKTIIVVSILIPACLLMALLVKQYEGHSSGKGKDSVTYLIGVSHPNLTSSIQMQMNKEIKEEVSRHKNTRVIFTDAAQDGRQQVEDIKTLMAYGIDLLIISVEDSATLTPVLSSVYKKIPVIVLGRGVRGYNYTLYIGSDNLLNGKVAAREAANLLGKKKGRIIEISGSKGSLQAEEKSKGFKSMLKSYPEHRIISDINGNWLRDQAEDKLTTLLQNGRVPNLVYAHNDAMAFGAYKALKKRGITGVKIIGSDGVNEENGGLALLAEKKIDATFISPTGGTKAVQYAMDILHKEPGVPKKIILRDHLVNQHNFKQFTENTRQEVSLRKKSPIKLGFAQVGSESAWRLANTDSIVSAAKEAGIDLIFKNAEYDQKKQLKIVQDFIKEGVDVIAFSPKVENGWEPVLTEAKHAGIPVILSDREINVKDQSLWTSFLGSDFVEEGRRAGRWLATEEAEAVDPVQIIELEGTKHSAPADDRKKGFHEIIQSHQNLNLLDSYSGDFTQDKGKEAMRKALKQYGKTIDVVFAHNDDMALGAMEAIEEIGMKPGVDIKIISIDATEKAFNALRLGKMNFSVECNPLLGPQLMKAIKDLKDGKEIPQRIITSEETFTQEQAKKKFYERTY